MKNLGSLATPPPRLPDPTGLDVKDPEAIRSFLVSLTSTLATQLQRRPPLGTTQPSRMFTAPDGTVFKVKVENDGTIVSEPLGSTNSNALPPT